MKIKNLFLLMTTTVLAGLMLPSCSNDSKVAGDGSALRFQTNIQHSVNPSPSARVAGDNWQATDAIGIFMYKTGTTTPVEAAYENVKHSTAGDGVFKAVPGNELYFAADGSAADFMAYYPHTAAVVPGLKYSVDVSNQSNPAAIDFLFTNKTKNVSGTAGGTVALTFEHQLSLITLTTTAGSGVPDLTGLKVKYTGLNTKAEFNLATAVLSGEADVADVQFVTTVSADKKSAVSTAIIIPGKTPNREIIFELGTNKYTYKMPDTQDYLAGMNHTIDAELSVDGKVGVDPNGTIKPWGDGGNIDLGALKPEGSTPPLPGPTGDGTKANPYSPADAIQVATATGVWVKGFVATPAAGYAVTPEFYLAPTKGETDKAKMVAVSLDGVSAEIKKALDVTANGGELVGKEVNIQADFAAVGAVITLSNVVAQEGGLSEDPTPPGPSGDPVEYFSETFGDDNDIAKTKFEFDKFPHYDVKTVTYSDPVKSGAKSWGDVRRASGNNMVWFPASLVGSPKATAFKIDGIDAGYKDVTLTYDILTFEATKGGDANIIIVKCNGTDLVVPSTPLVKDEYKTITIKLSETPTSIEFHSTTANIAGFRIDNIKLTGVAK